jgi:hypothetical protein
MKPKVAWWIFKHICSRNNAKKGLDSLLSQFIGMEACHGSMHNAECHFGSRSGKTGVNTGFKPFNITM